MYTFLIILTIIISILLVLVVLVQNPKGGGLASNFAASNQIMGVKKTGDFLEKATWTLAIALLVICLGVNMFPPSGDGGVMERSEIEDQIENAATAAPQMSPSAVPMGTVTDSAQ